VSRDAARLLYELAGQVERGCIIEVGSYRGRSTVALARGAAAGHGAPVYAIDPHEPFVGVRGQRFGPEDRAAFMRNMVRTGAYRYVRLLNVSSEVVSPGWNQPVGLLWLDGDHAYEAVRRDFNAWEPHLLPTSDLVLDDADDPQLGPHRLVRELTDEGWSVAAHVDKIVHLRRG
jgi:hypothetical protein